MEMVGNEFNEVVQFYRDSWLPARTIVESAFEERFKVIMVM